MQVKYEMVSLRCNEVKRQLFYEGGKNEKEIIHIIWEYVPGIHTDRITVHDRLCAAAQTHGTKDWTYAASRAF